MFRAAVDHIPTEELATVRSRPSRILRILRMCTNRLRACGIPTGLTMQSTDAASPPLHPFARSFAAPQVAPHWQPWQFVDSLFVQRMRTVEDRRAVHDLYAQWLGSAGYEPLGALASALDTTAARDPSFAPLGSPSAASDASTTGLLLQPHYSITRTSVQVLSLIHI